MSRLYDIFKEFPSISTDTRAISAGSIFFALKGANFNGNLFAKQALEQGAVWCVVDDESVVEGDRMILVDSVLETLQELAREHRRALGIPVFGVVGSNGKTTTKELLNVVLGAKYRVYSTRGNLNNHIGVPLTLLSISSDVEFAIVEMGASACGEIAELCGICEPNFGLLTNVGRAHLEGFGGPKGVRKGKGELFDYLEKQGAIAFVAQDDKTISQMASERPNLKVEGFSWVLGEGVPSQLEGDYNRANIAAAVAVGRYFNVPDELIVRAIAAYSPDNNRSQKTKTELNTLILDCYNANPSSMRASISNFKGEPLDGCDSKLMILGDMMELGQWSEAEHSQILELALTVESSEILLVGEQFKCALQGASNGANLLDSKISAFCSFADLREHMLDREISNKLILIKGSRSVGLERCLEFL